MGPRRLLLVVGLVVVIVIAGAFAAVSFHVLESETASNSSVGTSQANDATAPTGVPLQVIVLGEGPVPDRLADDLETSLSDRWTAITVAEEPTSVDGPVYVVRVGEADIGYNPVTPSARVTAHFAFVGAGNGTLAAQLVSGDASPVLTNENPYVVHGDVTVVDVSRGIVSMPGYYDHVSAQVTGELVTALTSAPGM